MPTPVDFETQLPHWASRHAKGEIEINLQLCTRDGRRVGNAVVACQTTRSHGTYWEVMTDMGTILRLEDAEVHEMFYLGDYIMKADDVEARYFAQERKCANV